MFLGELKDNPKARDRLDISAKIFELLSMKIDIDGLDASKRTDNTKLKNIAARIDFIEVLLQQRGLTVDEILNDEDVSTYNEIKNTVNSKLGREESPVDNPFVEPIDIDDEVTSSVAEIEARIAEIEESYISALFKHNLSNFEEELRVLMAVITRLSWEGKIPDSKKTALLGRIDAISDDIELMQKKYLLYDYEKSTNKVQFLEDIISKLEMNVKHLEKLLARYEGKRVILNVKIKALINSKIKKSKRMLSFLTNKLASDQENIPSDTRSDISQRKTDAEGRLKAVNQEYVKKCPLKVIKRKSAKSLYSNRKKMILYAVGVSTLALLLIPVILPSTIYGLNLLAFKVPLFKPILKLISKVLGAFTPIRFGGDIATVKAALLKGIALTGGGTAAIVTLVKGAQGLFERFRTSELRFKMSDKYKKIKDNVKDKAFYLKEDVKDFVHSVPERVRGRV